MGHVRTRRDCRTPAQQLVAQWFGTGHPGRKIWARTPLLQRITLHHWSITSRPPCSVPQEQQAHGFHTGVHCPVHNRQLLWGTPVAQAQSPGIKYSRPLGPQWECLPGARPARYCGMNYPDFSPGFTLPREGSQVDQSGPQTFPTKHAA